MSTPVIIGGQKIGKFKASWLLFKEAWRFLKADAELMWVPILSTILNVALFGILVTSFVVLGAFTGDSEEVSSLVAVGFVFFGYLISAFTFALAQATITNTVFIRAHNGDATLGQSLKVAISHWRALLVWSIIASTVGLILNAIYNRSQLLGRILTSLIGVAWGVLTYFVVPAIVLDKHDGVSAIRHSSKVFKATWGETLVSNISLGLVFFVAHLVVLLSFVGIMVAGIEYVAPITMILAIMAVIVWLVFAILVQQVMAAILKTLLYVYASEKDMPVNFNRELLDAMLIRDSKLATPVSLMSTAQAFETPAPPASTPPETTQHL